MKNREQSLIVTKPVHYIMKTTIQTLGNSQKGGSRENRAAGRRAPTRAGLKGDSWALHRPCRPPKYWSHPHQVVVWLLRTASRAPSSSARYSCSSWSAPECQGALGLLGAFRGVRGDSLGEVCGQWSARRVRVVGIFQSLA